MAGSTSPIKKEETRSISLLADGLFATKCPARSAGVKLLAFRTRCFQQETRCSTPICRKESRSYNRGLALAMPRDVQSGPNGSRPEHRRPACPFDYRDQHFTCGPEWTITRFWSATPIDLHRVGVANFCAGLLRGGFRARPEFLIKSGIFACVPCGDCHRCPFLMGEQALTCSTKHRLLICSRQYR